MSGAPSIRPHGVGVRGITLSRNSLLFQGRFGRIFRALPPADYGVDDKASEAALNRLAHAMVSEKDPKDPKDGADNEESGIPAVYTYFGQFIDHDLTFDPASSLQRQDDPDAIVDYRTPRFDLDNIYGRGPDDQPYLYETMDGLASPILIQGAPMMGAAANPHARDLPRSLPLRGGAARAIIGDPRNDENVIVSQFQGLMHRFHNQVAKLNPAWPFERVQREVRFHYQWVLLNDFLPTLISEEALTAVLPKATDTGLFKPTLQFFHPKDELFMPLEFSAAAYRFGHSMVRPGYRLSETIGPIGIFAKLPKPSSTELPDPSLGGFRKFPSDWAIDWNLFADLGPRSPSDHTRRQLAYKIDTSIVNPLSDLPPAVASDPPPNLAGRNLLRGWRMRLPTGQDVARAMGLVPLDDSQILIGKFSTGDDKDIKGKIVDVAGDAFAGNCPLWTYILAETVEAPVTLNTTDGVKTITARKLGPVGGRIVAETFVGLLVGDSSSYVSQNPLWTPGLARNGVFGLRELISTALDWSG